MTSVLLAGLLLSAAAPAPRFPATAPAPEAMVQRIGLTSCIHQWKPIPALEAINRLKPDTMVFLGDNVYLDSRDSSGDFATDYENLRKAPGFQSLVDSARTLAVWDDHDYGLNDAGEEYPRKAETQRLFADFWRLPADSPVRQRPGTYDSVILGPSGRRVQFLLLDTRTFRSPLMSRTEAPRGYMPDNSPDKTMLGAAQWKWLEEELKKPAEIRIICTSIQFVPEDHRFEKWMNLPRERQRMINLIRSTGANGVIMVSGDRHLSEISMMDAGFGYPLYDLTTSGLNSARADWRLQESNRWRVGSMNYGDSFATIDINWTEADPLIRLQMRDVQGEVVMQQGLRLSWLKPGRIPPATN